MSSFRFLSQVSHSAQRIFDWHCSPYTVNYLLPPRELAILRCPDKGSCVVNMRQWGPFWKKCKLKYHIDPEAKSIYLEDTCSRNKYKCLIESLHEKSSEVIEHIEWDFPFFLKKNTAKRRLSRILDYKHSLLHQDLELLTKYPYDRPLKVLISGSHGLIGQALCRFLKLAGHDIWHLVRGPSRKEKTIVWDAVEGKAKLSDFEGFNAIIHLAGENIGHGRWTKKKKKRFFFSRVDTTRHLTKLISQLNKPLDTFICASAVGFYGDQGDKWVSEGDHPSQEKSFLSQLCQKWECSAEELIADKGVRSVHPRFGVVFSDRGGALTQMVTPFKWGLGGVLGSGKQYLSWITLDDLVGALYHILMTPSLKGAVNCVTPNPISQRFLAHELARKLHRPCGPRMPASWVRMLLGQKGKELLLTSIRVQPQRLLETNYSFHYPTLKEALHHLI